MFIGLNNAITGLTQDQLSKTINSLFSKNEQGIWYDPSDLSTLYQDAAGKTPVTAVEQPVGLILDKSKGLVLGSELVTNGTFDSDTAWTKGAGWTISGGAALASNVSSILKQTLTSFAANKWYVVSFALTASAGTVQLRLSGVNGGYHFTTGQKLVYIYASTTTLVEFVATAFTGSIDNISVRELPGNHAYQSTSASRPVLSALVNQYLNTATLATQSVTTLATTYTLRFDGAGSITLSGTATGTYTAGVHSVVCTAGTLTSTVTGTVTNADLRQANTGVNLPPYQRVGASTDYDTAGFPHYLKFDGIDDSLVTNSIDFTGTDKMTVCAGVRKLSDADAAVLCEFGTSATTINGSFALFAPSAPRPDYGFVSRGSALANASSVSGQPAPCTHVVTGRGDIYGDSVILRVSGTQTVSSTADQGSGNYGNYPLYIGRRGGTSYPFNGQLYGLVIRGALSSTGEIQGSESYMNLHTGAY